VRVELPVPAERLPVEPQAQVSLLPAELRREPPVPAERLPVELQREPLARDAPPDRAAHLPPVLPAEAPPDAPAA
jgi:hypothetical protein